MNILFTICGREGSKGVKNKNIKILKDFPLIYYTIAAIELIKEKRKDLQIDSCINSDGKEILNVCKGFSDYVLIDRPKELATDASPKVPVIIYSLKYMEKVNNKQYDYVIDLDITSPLRTMGDIEGAIEKSINSDKDVVFSVVPARRNPYFNMVERKKNEVIKCKEGDFVRRQDAPEVFDMNASIYCYKRLKLIEEPKKSPLEYDFEIFEMKETGIIDIDSEKDFILLELLSDYYFKDEYKDIYDYLESMKID
jgi:CMP-N,N'-diacetyllegionaminic acid synthase